MDIIGRKKVSSGKNKREREKNIVRLLFDLEDLLRYNINFDNILYIFLDMYGEYI